MKLGLLLAGIFCRATLAVSAADGKDLFMKNCASCHGPDGKASTRAARLLGVKDLTVSKTDDTAIQKQILEGYKDPKGVQKMPPFKDKFKPDEIQALVEFVKSIRE